MSSLLYKIKILESECENAIIDFPFHDHVQTWISDHNVVYEKVALHMKEHSINNEEKDINFIAQFYLLYQKSNKKE
jgi:hypothetical protein